VNGREPKNHSEKASFEELAASLLSAGAFTAFTTIFSFLLLSVSFLPISACSEASMAQNSLAHLSNYSGTDFYNDPSFNISYPEGFNISASGGYPSGNLAIYGPSSRFSLTWVRDPGVEPSKYLGQIADAYKSKQVTVISKEKLTIPLKLSNASALNLTYSFEGYQSSRWLAAWRSNASDRLFYASICNPDGGAGCFEIFQSILSSFVEMDREDVVSLQPRVTTKDAWAILLQDLLASYHYTDPKVLPPKVVSVRVTHLLSPQWKSYRLSSKENISIEQPDMTLIRPRMIQELLVSRGYNARLVQWRGKVWMAVQDQTSGQAGSWQSVSLNPTEPWRTLGALVKPEDGWYCGTVYDDLEELCRGNGIKIEEDNWIAYLDAVNTNMSLNHYIVKDCDPPIKVELLSPSELNQSWVRDLQAVLDSHDYPEKYQVGVFDCSNTSQICWSLLQGKGYDARLMFSWVGHPLGPHMWVVVSYPDQPGRYIAVEATTADKEMNLIHMGKVKLGEEYYKGIMYNTSAQYSRLHPEEGMGLVPQSIV
jgi:hypothetical protein